jgi:hypothetical protein
MAVTIKLFVYKICISQNTTIFVQQSLCVLKSDMFRPRIGHSQAQNNSTKQIEGDNVQVAV